MRKGAPDHPDEFDSLIVEVRRHTAILDSDLASIYGVPTKRLNEQVNGTLAVTGLSAPSAAV